MRCPKCGFISFDYLETCLKCKKNIQSTSEKLHGSVFNVAAPTFLKFTTEPEAEEFELDEAFVDDGDVFGDEEIRDPDLDILIDDDDAERYQTPSDDEEATINLAEDDADGGIEFQLGGFDEDADLGGMDEEEESAPIQAVNIEVPDELSDMSDLEPPPVLKEVEEDVFQGSENDLDLDLDLDLNLNLGDEELGSVAEEAKSVDLADLSLQDLDFDVDEELPSIHKKADERKINLDEDLDFELDLGDLKLDDDDKL